MADEFTVFGDQDDGDPAIEYEWAVVWFPPNRKSQESLSRAQDAEAKMRKVYQEKEDLGFAPILVKREIRHSPWTEVLNGTMDRYMESRRMTGG